MTIVFYRALIGKRILPDLPLVLASFTRVQRLLTRVLRSLSQILCRVSVFARVLSAAASCQRMEAGLKSPANIARGSCLCPIFLATA